MEKKARIASGVILCSIGILISLAQLRHALYLTGVFIAFSGLGLIVEIFENTEK